MLKLLLILSMIYNTPSQNSKRIMMLFADGGNSHKLLQQQQQMLNTDKAGCAEREIEVHVYSPKDMAIYKKYNILHKGFTVVLIGKDGGEKLRRHTPVTTKKLFAIIDAMPMRKEVISHSDGYGE